MALVTTGSPERRVPIILPSMAEDRIGMADNTWDDLQKTLGHEAENVKKFGQLTPRRIRKGDVKQASPAPGEENDEEGGGSRPTSSPGKKKLPAPATLTEVELVTVEGADNTDLERQEVQEGRPPASSIHELTLMNSPAIRNPRPATALRIEAAKKDGGKAKAEPKEKDEVAEDPCNPNRKSKLFGLAALPTLRFYFDMVGREGCQPDVYLGLRMLHRAASEVDHRVLWNVETDLERRVRERQELAASDEKEKRERMKALREEQYKELNPQQSFQDAHTKAMEDLVLEKDRDQATLATIEDAIQREKREEEREAKRMEHTKEIICNDKEAREARSRDRQAQVDALLDEEEEHRDTQLAAERVRHRFDKAKEVYRESGDENKLDEY